MNKDLLLQNLRNIPDFPIPGIQFKDVTSLFKKPECLREMDSALYDMYKVTGDKKALLFKERNGAKISYKDGCLYVTKDGDNLMRVRKEVNGYATWIKYYYPDGEEELVYYKKN